jgi:hypothetical protein
LKGRSSNERDYDAELAELEELEELEKRNKASMSFFNAAIEQNSDDMRHCHFPETRVVNAAADELSQSSIEQNSDDVRHCRFPETRVLDDDDDVVRDHSGLQLDAFPDEILVKIIGHLPTRDIVKTVSLLSKRMNQLSKDRSVRICVSSSENVNSVLAIPERARQVERLDLNGFSLSVDQILGIKNLKSIKIKVEVRNFIGSRAFTQELIDGLAQLKNLKSVELSGKFEQSCFTNLGALKHLKHISLGLAHCSITEQELKSLAELGEVSALDLKLISSTVMFTSNGAATSFPENFTFSKNCKQEISFVFKEFSALGKMLSHFPNVGVLNAFGLNHPTVNNQEEISDLHSLVVRCENLNEITFNFQVNLEMFRNVFIDWQVTRYCGMIYFTKKLQNQCFSTGVPRNPRVLWASSKGSANFPFS